MGEEWVEIAALWKPRSEGSRLICKGKVVEKLREGEKVLLMRNDYATEENRQPQFRLMVVRENPNIPFEEDICLYCGEKMNPLEIDNGDSYHMMCHDPARAEVEFEIEEEKRLNPHGMG